MTDTIVVAEWLDPLLNPQDVAQVQYAENLADARQLAEDAVAIRAIMSDTEDLIILQGEAIVSVDDTMEDAGEDVEQAGSELEKARRASIKGMVWKVTVLGVVLGCTLGFPVGAGVALAAQATGQVVTAGVFGSVVGTAVGGASAFAAQSAKKRAMR